MPTEFTLSTPADFRFLPTVLSHGWCRLPPFACAENPLRLWRTEKLSDGTITHFEVFEAAHGRNLHVSSRADLTLKQQAEIGSIIARCLSFDHSLLVFHERIQAYAAYRWIAQVGAGRMLCSPGVWEDLAKTLLTTNTTWAMTIGMVTRLAALGEPAPESGHSFPTAEQIAALAPEALNQQVRAGYRGAYLHAVATAIASGALDVEAWRDPAMPSAEVYRAIKRIKGFGDYAAGAMMRLLGRFDQLGLDSLCRGMYAQRYNGGTPATDREIAAYYAPFEEWRGLVVWLDVMRDDLTGR